MRYQPDTKSDLVSRAESNLVVAFDAIRLDSTSNVLAASQSNSRGSLLEPLDAAHQGIFTVSTKYTSRTFKI